jgi:E3 ubiquitin-protein ligase RBBP6
MAVYFKFKSAKDFDSVSIDGHFISVATLKEKIVEQKKLGRGSDYDLVIANAQTDEGLHFLLNMK